MRVSLNNLPAQAKTYSVEFPKLTGGLNLWELDYRMDANQSPNMKNLWWQDGVLQCRDGQAYATKTDNLGTGYTCYSTIFWGYAFFHIGTKLYCGEPSASMAELTEVCTGVSENRGTFFRYLDWLFYKNKGGFIKIAYEPGKAGVPFTVSNVVDEAYTPVTMLNAHPSYGSGDTYQPENRLSPKKTIRYNALADAKIYKLPVQNVDSVVQVKVDGVVTTDYTADLAAGTVTFNAAPPVTEPATNNTVEITYSKANPDALSSIMDCEYAMVAGGDTNLCILLAGCDAQPNAVFWNDRDNLSMNPAYWPMTYYNLVGDTEDPVTGFGRQYSDLIVLKEHSVGKLEFGAETANVDDRNSISFSYVNINSKVGCDLPWSIQLIENNLVFCNTYQGVQIVRSSSAAYENNVECISRNVNGQSKKGLLYDVRQADVVTSFDDDDRYWLCANGNVYAWDYVLSTSENPSWFFFTNISGVSYFRDSENNLYHLDSRGRVTRFGRHFTDYEGPIEKLYQFPAQDFGSYEYLKDITRCVFSVRSDTDSIVDIEYQSDYETRHDYTDIRSMSWRLTPRNLAYRALSVQKFAHVAHRKPGCRHVRHFSMKLSNNELAQDLAILSAQIQYRFTGRDR